MAAEAQPERGRPSPDALLRQAERADRSRLKVFLGASPGVGKTYAMLEAARELQRRGVDVVAGVVETHGRKETEDLLHGLEVVPPRRLEYRGRNLLEMDLDAILARRPAVVLADELAHTNAPGSRHTRRFQDVEELLAAGIDVYTTVNIQHLESLNDVVTQVTGVRVRETVPDVVLDRADEVKLIDLPPEDLLQRLREGKVYLPEQAERAIRNYFRPGNLAALRELALRETAEHVDEQVQDYMRAHAVEGPWSVAERVLVGVSGGVLSQRLVRAARRIAERRGAPWIAAFVEPANFQSRPDAERERAGRALRLAERLGGEAVVLPGDDVAEEISRYARQRNVSEIVVGRSVRPWWRTPFGPSTVDRIVRRSQGVDVRVISVEPRASIAEAPAAAVGMRHASPLGYLLAAAFVAAAAGVFTALSAVSGLSNPGMIFLLAVLLTAVTGGLGPSLFAAVLGVVAYDFFFTAPYYSLAMAEPHEILSLAVFVVAAVLTSQLTARARDQAASARQREATTAALYGFSRAITGAATPDDLARAIAAHAAELFGAPSALLLRQGERLEVRAASPAGTELTEAERATSRWVLDHGQPAGRGTDTLPASSWLHVPLATVRGTAGVLALRISGSDPLELDRRQLLEAIAVQAALALERTRVDLVEAVIESIEDGLVVLDPAGVVLHLNEVACAILDCDRAAAVGSPFEALGTDHPHYLRLRAAVRDLAEHPERESGAVELALFLRGRDHFFILRPNPLRAHDGAPAGQILVLQDVTYLRDQEARREQMLATLSHELRTPLASLRMALELSGREPTPLDERRRELLAAATEDSARLEEVTQRLLELSRSRAMTIPLERRRVDLREVVERVTRIFSNQARERGVSLETDLAEGDPAVRGDPTKLTWALSNLVANALRYTPASGRVTIEVRPHGEAVLLAVADTGPGIPREQRERIFERFTQGSEGEIGGTGLGLAIVRDIVQAHGGRIHLETEVGRGSRFVLELPRA